MKLDPRTMNPPPRETKTFRRAIETADGPREFSITLRAISGLAVARLAEKSLAARREFEQRKHEFEVDGEPVFVTDEAMMVACVIAGAQPVDTLEPYTPAELIMLAAFDFSFAPWITSELYMWIIACSRGETIGESGSTEQHG